MQTRDTFPALTTKPKGGKTMPCGSKGKGGKKR